MPGDGRGVRAGFGRLVREALRRRVFTTLLWYAGAAVTVVEGGDVLLSLGDGSVRLLRGLALCGVPLALVLGWFYDIESPAGGGRGSRGRRIAALGVTGVVSVAGFLVLFGRDSAPAAPGEPPVLPVERVALLPLDVPGASPELEALATSLHGRLIDGLSAAGRTTTARRRLSVISRAGVLPFSAPDIPPDSIGRALDVGVILEGTVEGTGDRVHARLRLIDARTAEQIGSTVAEASAGDHLALVDAVADSLLGLVRRQLGAVVTEQVRLLGTDSREAFDLVVRGEELVDEFRDALDAGSAELASESLLRADSLFARAAALDPAWGEPLVERGELADDRAMLAVVRGDADLASIYEAGLRHATRAVSLDPEDPAARTLRGSLRLRLAAVPGTDPERGRRLEAGAEADLRAALVDNPRPGQTLRLLSELLARQGRTAEALAYGERAYREDPYLEDVEPTLYRLFQYSLGMGRDAEAAAWCDEGRRRFDHPMFHDCRLLLMAWSEIGGAEPDSAWATVRAELEAYPLALHSILEPRLHGLVAAVLVRSGRADSARSLLASAARADPGTAGFALTAAGVHRLLGDTVAVLARVEEFVSELGDPRWRPTHAPELRGMEDHPRIRQEATRGSGG